MQDIRITLLRNNERRVTLLREALADCPQEDRRKRERLAADLAEQERMLADRLAYLSER